MNLQVMEEHNVLDKLEWPSLEARREQATLTWLLLQDSLLSTVSLEKDK